MNSERREHDDELTAALRDVAGDPTQEHVDWDRLARTVRERAAPELARRRWRGRGLRYGLPAALAASIGFLVLSVAPQAPTDIDSRTLASAEAPAESLTVDDLLDAGVSERQFRALLFWAAEADELLLIAAADEERQ